MGKVVTSWNPFPMVEQRDTTYRQIREKLLDGSIRSPRDLSRRRLAAALDATPTHTQWALNRMEAEGLLESRPQSGTFVRKLSPQELQGVAQKSCGVLQRLGPQIQWVHSYVTDNKIYCVYRAPNEELIREHARLGGFPANKVSQVRTTIDPTTAE